MIDRSKLLEMRFRVRLGKLRFGLRDWMGFQVKCLKIQFLLVSILVSRKVLIIRKLILC